MSDLIHPFIPSKYRGWRLSDDAAPLHIPWRWPLQPHDGREVVVLGERVHEERMAVDLGYEPRAGDLDRLVPVYAAQGGEVALAGETPAGFFVTLDHGHRNWSTHYAHLSRLFVAPYRRQRRRRQRVHAGDVIGYAARTPLHVRFELWNWTNDRGFVPVDSIAMLTHWGLSRPRDAEQSEVTEKEAA